MAAPRLPLRTSSTASQESAHQDALRGATLAFSRPSYRAPSNSYTSVTGASGASPDAIRRRQSATSEQEMVSTSPQSLKRVATGDSVHSVKSNAIRQRQPSTESVTSHLNSLPQATSGQAVSPSQRAAGLAVANAQSSHASMPLRAATTKKPAAPPKPRCLSSYGGGNLSERETDTPPDSPTDSTSIPPTSSLVDIFERTSKVSQAHAKRPEPIVIKSSGDLPLESPKPLRSASGITSVIQMKVDNDKTLQVPAANNSARRESDDRAANTDNLPILTHPMSLDGQDTDSVAISSTRNKEDTVPPRLEPRLEPLRPQPRGRTGPETVSIEPVKPPEGRRNLAAASPSPLRKTTTEPISIQQINRQMASPSERLSPSSASVTAQYNLLHPRKINANLTGDQLVNAMVASSLASSRQSSPARTLEPPSLPPRQKKHYGLSFSRTPSPTKTPGLKKTLRQPQSESSDDEEYEGLYPHGKRKVQKRIGKHPNKHHEGDRKRWRAAVTDRERKRYEGVWAANKGLYASFTFQERDMVSRAPDSDEAQEIRDAVVEQVSNIIVRDIWSRSRLSDEVLENVWDLVDNHQVGRLTKEEFVVGLWLIDGRLKGKKLPVKVSDSVWSSVKGLQGIRIRK